MLAPSTYRLCFTLVALAASWGLGSSAAAQTGDRYAGVQFEAPSVATATAPAEPLLSYRRPDTTAVNPLRPQPTPPLTAAVVDSATSIPLQSIPTQFDANVEAANASAAIDESDYAEPPLAPAEDATATPLQTPTTAIASTPAPPSQQFQVPVTPAAQQPSTTLPAQQLPIASPNVLPSAAVEAAPLRPTTYDADDRRLAPPSTEASRGSRNPARSTLLPAAFSQLGSLSSAGMGLVVVVGLFLACALLLKKGAPKSAGLLPAEAFAVLGRAQIAPQNFAHLLRLGNKLVLVAMTPDGVQPLAEVTEPTEVDRIAGLCEGGKKGGSSAEFQQVLAQLSREPARGFLGREASGSRRR